MHEALFAARLLLALIFGIAGAAKLADLRGSRAAVGGFGVPAALAAPLGSVLPLIELAIAITLLPGRSSWPAAIAAAALLGLFVVGVAVNLARGRAPDCHCFGQLHSEPVGWRTLARNTALLIVAAFVVARGSGAGQLSAFGWIGSLSAAEQASLVLSVAALLLGVALLWLLLQLIAQNGRLLTRLDAIEAARASNSVAGDGAGEALEPPAGLPIDAPAPGFNVGGLYGETQTLDALRAAGRPLLLFFTDPNCGPCQALQPDIARWQRELSTRISVVLLSRGAVEENRAKAAEQGLTQVFLQADREVANAYQAFATPSAVLVRPDGRIGSGLAQGAEQIRALVARIATPLAPPAAPIPVPVLQPQAASGASPCPNCGQVHSNGAATQAPAAAQGLPVGAAAPDLTLTDLNGRAVSLADFRGRNTAVLFWNPGCGFCQQLLPELKSWEADRPANTPALLVVSTGGVEANAAQALASTLVLDDGFRAGNAFGAGGTPSAVLIGADGRVAAPLGVGGPAVMALLRGEPQAAAAGAAVERTAATIGDAAPELSLPDLDGRQRTLREYRGRATLLLFWDPGCGFCQAMLDNLKRWEADPPAGAPRLLLVSTGTVAANRAHGLRARILLDFGFGAGKAFGATGTPAAVLLDAGGRIASEVAVGAEAVLALADRRP